MSSDNLEVQYFLHEIEELFDRCRPLPQESRAIILGKLITKLHEEFKDFTIQERNINQETVVEISYEPIVEDNGSKIANIIMQSGLPVELTVDIENDWESKPIDNKADFFPSIEKDEIVQIEPEKVIDVTANPVPNPPQQKDDVIIVEKPAKKPKTKTCFICNYCGKQYRKRKLFKIHLRRHENDRKYECAKCSARFNVKDDLIKHLRITHSSEKKFICTICSKLFVTNNWLQNHIKAIHERSEKFCCPECKYFSFSKHTLGEHVRVKHRKKYEKYACLICKNVYISRAELKVHLRTHTGEKPYKCELCNAAFIRSGHLTNHKNIVHGEKKFPCENCDKSFATSHKLKRHIVIHTRSKPFKCPFCNNYACNNQPNLNKHVKLVHQLKEFSYAKYMKKKQGPPEPVQEEWIKNAEPFTKEYLETFSKPPLTIEKLKKQYLKQKKKKPMTEKNTDPSDSDSIDEPEPLTDPLI